MKKTFALSHPKHKPARLVDSIKHEVKKYIKRERNKALPTDADYWDFDCKIGADAEQAQELHLNGINKAIDALVAQSVESFYLEIMARAAARHYEPREELEADEAESGEQEDEFDDAE